MGARNPTGAVRAGRSIQSAPVRAALVVLLLGGCGKIGGGGGKGAAPEELYQGKSAAAWVAQLEEGRGEARLQAARAVGAIGAAAKGAVPALLEALKDGECRAAAALSLGSFGAEARVAAPALVEALRDEDGDVRTAAATALEKIGAAAVPPLVAAVQRRQDPPFYGEDGSWFDELVRVKPHIISVGLVVVALAALGVFLVSFRLWIRHRERIVRLERGMDPDAPAAGAEPEPAPEPADPKNPG